MTARWITRNDIGCWVDDSRGHYMGERIQEIAAAYGWPGEQLHADHEFYYDAWDEAVDYLNSICPEGLCFVSENGPFCLVESEEEEH